MVSDNFGAGLAVGVPVAIGSAVYLAISLNKIGRGRAAKKGENRYH